MIYQGKTIELKDGRRAELRAPRPEEDAPAALEVFRRMAGETEFVSNYPEEIRFTAEGEAAYLKNTVDSPDNMLIVCSVEGVMAGNCQIIFLNTRKTRHRAVAMIGLQKEFWGLGIGTALFEELIAAARHRGGVTQLELEVVEGNERAIALYEKMGFTVMAEHPDAFRLKDGSSRKAIYMRRPLE